MRAPQAKSRSYQKTTQILLVRRNLPLTQDTEYGFGSLKAESKPATLGLKESVQNDSESAAIAKLLIKLIKSTNQSNTH